MTLAVIAVGMTRAETVRAAVGMTTSVWVMTAWVVMTTLLRLLMPEMALNNLRRVRTAQTKRKRTMKNLFLQLISN